MSLLSIDGLSISFGGIQALSDVGDALPLYDAAWTEIQAA